MTAVTNLNSYIHGTVLEFDLGLSVGCEPGAPARCPACEQVSLEMYDDPLGGHRFVCRSCRFSVSSVELYAHVHGLDLLAAGRQLGREQTLPGLALIKWLPAWINRVARPQARLIELLAAGRARLDAPEHEWLAALDALQARADTGTHPVGRTLPQGVAGIQRTELHAAIQPWTQTLRTGNKRFTTMLVIPFCDIYNRPRSLAIFDSRGRAWHCMLPLTHVIELPPGTCWENRVDAGLCFLDELPGAVETVYAVEGGRWALQLFTMEREPFHVVGWHRDTGRASWSNMRARQTILWSPQPDVHLFKQAMLADHGHVAMEPALPGDTPGDMQSRLRELGADAWRRQVDAAARPWPVALADWLSRRNEKQVSKDLALINPNRADAERLVDGTTDPGLKLRLAHALNILEVPRSIWFREQTLTQVAGRWTAQGRRSFTNVLSVELHIDKIQQPIAAGKPYVTGYVRVGLTTQPFHEPLDRVQDDTARWLRDFCVGHGLTLPLVDARWRNHLFDIALAFCNPPTVTCAGRVGYEPAYGGYVFPQFVLRDGQVDREAVPEIAGTRIPGGQLEPPTVPARLPADLFTPTDANTMFWALLMAMAGNALAQQLDLEPRGVVVEAPNSPQAPGRPQRTIVNIACGLDLPVYNNPKTDLRSLDVGHLLPPVVDGRRLERTARVPYLYDLRPKSLLLLTESLEGWRCPTLGGWISVASLPEPAAPVAPEQAAGALLSLLQQLNSDGYDQMPHLDDLAASLLIQLPPRRVCRDGNVQELIHRVQQCLGGDKAWECGEAERALFPLLSELRWSDRMHSYTHDDGVVSLPLSRLVPAINTFPGAKLKPADLKHRLKKHGLLEPSANHRLNIAVDTWDAKRALHERMLPLGARSG